nr:hypothetical protein [Tanacetum cinerariifolium]
MSSSNHLTFNIKDAFYEYISVVTDYSPVSPGKTYSSASNNSTDIEEILNHLDELPLDCIERIEDDVEGLVQRVPPKRSSTSEASTMSQAAIKKLVADSISAALETQTATMAKADNPIRNTRPREILVAKRGNYKEFISCQPFYFNGVLQIGISAMVIENKVETLTITTFSFSQESPPCRYISVPLHFSKFKIPPEFLPFYNMKDIQAFYAKELPIPSPDTITLLFILTPFQVLPPSLLFDPRHFFVLEELLPPNKQIFPPSSSSTTLSNSSQKLVYILVPPSFLTYTPTPPQIYELGKSSIKMHVKHHEEQVESILSYLEELFFHYIEKMEERLVNGWIIIPRDFDEVKTFYTSPFKIMLK